MRSTILFPLRLWRAGGNPARSRGLCKVALPALLWSVCAGGVFQGLRPVGLGLFCSMQDPQRRTGGRSAGRESQLHAQIHLKCLVAGNCQSLSHLPNCEPPIITNCPFHTNVAHTVMPSSSTAIAPPSGFLPATEQRDSDLLQGRLHPCLGG